MIKGVKPKKEKTESTFMFVVDTRRDKGIQVNEESDNIDSECSKYSHFIVDEVC